MTFLVSEEQQEQIDIYRMIGHLTPAQLGEFCQRMMSVRPRGVSEYNWACMLLYCVDRARRWYDN